MNTLKTRQFVINNQIIALKADKTHPNKSHEINDLLVELGNFGQAIPYYAIYPANGSEPIILENLITQSQLLDALERATQGQQVASLKARQEVDAR